MDAPSDPPNRALAGPPAEPRQRWRIGFARAEPASAETVGRAYQTAWEQALAATELPLVLTDHGRPRFALAAPLPIGVSAKRELLDVWFGAVLEAWRVREALESHLPAGHSIVGLENVWLGAPPLPGRVIGAEYLVALEGGVDPAALRAAAARIGAAGSLPRERAKGGGVKRYDLRPLLGDVAVERAEPDLAVRFRTITDPELGSGRPDEVVAALGDEVGAPLGVRAVVRERIVLADDA
ncbi:MAG TPA: DUF2344 domain-containing protein [Candidatus Limnocylindrales bacterium]|nr:DUF2344 domain-containing protein [Candidatus Limnocylindrales bacterium]